MKNQEKKFHGEIICLIWSNTPLHFIFTKKFRTLDPHPPMVWSYKKISFYGCLPFNSLNLRKSVALKAKGSNWFWFLLPSFHSVFRSLFHSFFPVAAVTETTTTT